MCRKRDGDAEVRLTRGYVRICLALPSTDGAKTVSLARCGPYDVRLLEFESERPDNPPQLWLELYSHETQRTIDSYRCCDLEADVQTTEELIAHAEQLNAGLHETSRDGECSADDFETRKTLTGYLKKRQ